MEDTMNLLYILRLAATYYGHQRAVEYSKSNLF